MFRVPKTLFCTPKVKERIQQEQDEERQRLESEMQRLVALEEEHRRKVQAKEMEMARIKEDLEKKWDRERRQVRDGYIFVDTLDVCFDGISLRE